MRKKGVLYGGIIAALFVIVLVVFFIWRNPWGNEAKEETVIPLDELNDIVEIDVYHMVDGEYEHEHMDEKEIQKLVEFFHDREYTSGKETDKDGFLATVLFKDSDGAELSVTILSSYLLAVESSKDSRTVMYESEHIGEDFEEFYPNLLRSK